jgi:hypothetical protein
MLRRERDLLTHQLDATRDMLQQQLDATRDYRDQIRYLTQMLRDMQQHYDRLLEAPRPAPAASPVHRPADVHPVTDLAVIPAAWQRIMDYIWSVNRSVKAEEVQRALELDHTPRHMLNRMAHRGVLQRVAPGVYGLEG